MDSLFNSLCSCCQCSFLLMRSSSLTLVFSLSLHLSLSSFTFSPLILSSHSLLSFSPLIFFSSHPLEWEKGSKIKRDLFEIIGRSFFLEAISFFFFAWGNLRLWQPHSDLLFPPFLFSLFFLLASSSFLLYSHLLHCHPPFSPSNSER